MRPIFSLILTIFIKLVLSNTVFAVQTMPLNTGYNHSPLVDAVYPITPATQDNYWIRYGSGYPPLSPAAAAPSWAINHVGAPWIAPPVGSNSTWINATNTWASPLGTSPDYPSYYIYRKCFCLLPGFNNARMRFQVRADDSVAIWFNNFGNQILPTSTGNWGSGQPYQVNVETGFRVGRNCLYVLIGDVGTYAGFNLWGAVQANGLLPTPSFGTSGPGNQGVFQPCNCQNGPAGIMKKDAEDNDSKIVEQIMKSVSIKTKGTNEKK